MSKCYILIGTPCSGKSTYAKKLSEQMPSCDNLSCDNIREFYFSKAYNHSLKNEKFVWEIFYGRIDLYVKHKLNFVIDNTNCREKYINNITSRLSENYEIIYVWFESSTWKLFFRNYKRWLFTGKWIPKDVMRRMQNNYKVLKQNLYKSVEKNSTVIKN